MPEGFKKCQKAGGKIRTVSGPNKKLGLANGEYVRVCISGGKTYVGYKEANHLENEMKRGKKPYPKPKGD